MKNAMLRILLLLVFAQAGLADVASPVDRVDVRAAGPGVTQVIVRFLWPVTLRSHTPREHGRNLEVELGFVPGAGALAANAVLPPWRSGSDPAARGIYESMRLDGDPFDGLGGD